MKAKSSQMKKQMTYFKDSWLKIVKGKRTFCISGNHHHFLLVDSVKIHFKIIELTKPFI